MHKKHQFYGTTTLGKKGQVVIPIQARKNMRIAKNEQLLVFGLGQDLVVLSKLSNLEKMAERLEKRLAGLKNIIKKNT